MEALFLKRSFTSAFGNSLALLVRFFGGIWVVPRPNEGLNYLEAPMELSGTLEGSLQIKKIVEYPTQFYVQAYV